MTISSTVRHFPLKRTLWSAAFALALPGVSVAWQANGQSTIRPVSPSERYQQSAQQQRTRDQLQTQQMQQQLREGVSDNAKRPLANDANARKQLDQADQAQRERDRARLQDLLDSGRDAASLPRVVPKDLPPPKVGD